jgi:hypothetical protein
MVTYLFNIEKLVARAKSKRMEHSAWGMEQEARSQNPGKKHIEIELFSTSGFFAASPSPRFTASRCSA